MLTFVNQLRNKSFCFHLADSEESSRRIFTATRLDRGKEP